MCEECRRNLNETPTEPGYCEFYDQFGCHAYMGGRSEGRPEWGHREGWTTCCDVDTQAAPSRGERD
jgi:hypothetical protein